MFDLTFNPIKKYQLAKEAGEQFECLRVMPMRKVMRIKYENLDLIDLCSRFSPVLIDDF